MPATVVEYNDLIPGLAIGKTVIVQGISGCSFTILGATSVCVGKTGQLALDLLGTSLTSQVELNVELPETTMSKVYSQ